MSFVYFTKEKILTSEERFSKDKIKELFNGIVIVRKTWWKYKYGKKHNSKGTRSLKLKLPKGKIIGVINTEE